MMDDYIMDGDYILVEEDPGPSTGRFRCLSLFLVPFILAGQMQETWSDLTTLLEETLEMDGILLVKNFNRQRKEAESFRSASRKLAGFSLQLAMNGRWFFMTLGLLSTLGPAIIYLFGGLEAAGTLPGKISLGEIVAFVALLSRLYVPASQLSNIWVSTQIATTLLDRLFRILDETPEIADVPNAQPLPPIIGEVVFDQVSFSYESASFALRDISFCVQPGQLVALVGPSGAGKTTLTYLLTRFYDVVSGTIRIDGYDIRQVQQASLAAQIGMVTQETHLFHASIRENIAYGHLEATNEQIISAAQAAGIHDLIVGLPQGYETLVGERGYRLSGGEKQRIAIARVILKNPSLLILDEATSALDSQSEARIQAALEPLMRGRTTIVIAHRLSTILAADLILVLDQGQIVESGIHQELLAREGLYYRLYHGQIQAEPAYLPSSAPDPAGPQSAQA
jgi:ATP-binding cassette subfamily B protein